MWTNIWWSCKFFSSSEQNWFAFGPPSQMIPVHSIFCSVVVLYFAQLLFQRDNFILVVLLTDITSWLAFRYVLAGFFQTWYGYRKSSTQQWTLSFKVTKVQASPMFFSHVLESPQLIMMNLGTLLLQDKLLYLMFILLLGLFFKGDRWYDFWLFWY